MAKRILTGKTGTVVVGSATVHIESWSFDPEAKLTETTDTADVTNGTLYETHVPVAVGAKGSFKANWDANAIPTAASPNLQPGVSVALRLNLETNGKYINVPVAIITNLPIASEAKGKITFSCSFTVSGPFTLPV